MMSLPDQIEDLRLRLEAKEKTIRYLRGRITFLEWRLSQRLEITVNDYAKLSPYLEKMKGQIMKIFLELSPDQGLNYEEIMTEFRNRYPDFQTKNVPRRVRELVNEGKLWVSIDPDRKARVYLKLKIHGKR